MNTNRTSFDVLGFLTTKVGEKGIEISGGSYFLLAGRPRGFCFLHLQGQGQSFRHFRWWEGSHSRGPGTG